MDNGYLQWGLVAFATVAYYLIVHLDYFLSESVQSAYLLQSLGPHDGRVDVLATQPLGVRSLLSGLAVTPAADISFKAIAVLQSGATVVFSTLLLKRYFKFPVAVAGALLMAHFTWPGGYAFLPISWVGPLFAAFAYFLIKGNQAWALGCVLLLSALFCTPLLVIEVLILLFWFLGEGIGEFDRPLIVRSTLGQESVLSLTHWLKIALGVFIAVAIAWLSLVPLTFGGSKTPFNTAAMAGGSVGYSDTFSGGNALSEIFMTVPFSIWILSVGAFILGWMLGGVFRRPAYYIVALLIAGGVYSVIQPWFPDTWNGYGAYNYALMIFVPTLLILLVGFADSYFRWPWISAVSVTLLLLWIPAYTPMLHT